MEDRKGAVPYKLLNARAWRLAQSSFDFPASYRRARTARLPSHDGPSLQRDKDTDWLHLRSGGGGEMILAYPCR